MHAIQSEWIKCRLALSTRITAYCVAVIKIAFGKEYLNPFT